MKKKEEKENTKDRIELTVSSTSLLFLRKPGSKTHPKYGVKGKGKDEGDKIEKHTLRKSRRNVRHYSVLFFLRSIKVSVVP